MSTTLQLTLADFQATVPFSNKIEDAQVRPFIDLSFQLDLVPLLGWPVLEAVGALTVPTLAAYAPGAPVAAGVSVVRAERVYKALLDTNLPPPEAPAWQYQPLLTLWTQYLKAYWLRASYARFLAQHGTDVTKAGLTQPNDGERNTFVRAPSADRASLLAAADSTAEAMRSRLTAFLAAESRAHQSDNTLGYAYGPGASTCAAATTTTRAPLRGINSGRRRPR